MAERATHYRPRSEVGGLIMENTINGFDFAALPVRIDFVGKVDEKEWPHFLWNVTVTYTGGFWSFPFKCGLGHVEKRKGAIPMPNPPYRKGTIAHEQWAKQAFQPKKPSVSDVMYAILLDIEAADMSFNDWCAEFGMDNDSTKAFKTYQTCCEYAVFVRKAFTREQIQAMKEALVDY